mgnify:CR=1 FL=1
MTKEREKYLEKREDEVSRFWGLQYDRHGVFSEPVKEVSWDLISKPMNSLEYDIANGVLTSTSIPGKLIGKTWLGAAGNAPDPGISFDIARHSGIYLSGSEDIGFSVDSTEQAVLTDDLTLTNRLIWKDGTAYKGEFIHANSADRTYTFQNATGTVYQTGGTDVAIADGGTGQSTRTFATVYKSADQDHDDDTLQNDDDLVFAINASETWTGTMVLFVADLNSGGSADFKIKITVPSGATVRYGSTGGDGIITLGEDSQGYIDSTSSTLTFDHSTTDEYIHEIRFSVKNSTNAGNVQLQWAQNTDQPSNVRVVQGSFLEATRVV